MTDWSAVSQSFFNGLLWGAGFALPMFIGLTWAILRILSHPTIRSIARAADKLSGGQTGFWDKLGSMALSGLGGFLSGGKPPGT